MGCTLSVCEARHKVRRQAAAVEMSEIRIGSFFLSCSIDLSLFPPSFILSSPSFFFPFFSFSNDIITIENQQTSMNGIRKAQTADILLVQVDWKVQLLDSALFGLYLRNNHSAHKQHIHMHNIKSHTFALHVHST